MPKPLLTPHLPALRLPALRLPALRLPALRLPALPARSVVIAATAAATTVVGVLLPGTAAAAPSTPVVAAIAPVAPVAPVGPALAASALWPAGAGASAVEHALSKIGSPYRYGADGPNAFDCSGLVSWAFEQAGVSLPRTSRAMSKVGEQVSRDELRRGDLVFFYKPVKHVAIYVGDGEIVHASNKKNPVKISDMDGMKFHSARRV